MTVGGELNKLAANIALGRNIAGVHWRSDYTESIVLGEEVAVKLMTEQAKDFAEDFQMSFQSFKHELAAERVVIEGGNGKGRALWKGKPYPFQ